MVVALQDPLQLDSTTIDSNTLHTTSESFTMASTGTGQSTTDKIKAKIGLGKKDYSKQARADRKQQRIAAGHGSDTSSSSEDEAGNRYTEEERQRRKKDHAAKREARRAKNKVTPNK